MAKVALIKLILIVLCVSSAFGQKVKYKDIFGLLSAKQYESAEPFLKRYLKDNTDNPNAYLYMGIIYQERANKEDILKNTRKTIAYMDSSIYFFDKAYKGLTEKEVKRNDEYYQIYNRRDLRTGEFGVKLSDIQFDLEKKMEGLREKIDRVKMIKYYFSLADSFYRKSNIVYQALQKAFPGEKELYLRSDESTLQQLNSLATRYDSSMKAFDNYKASSANLGSKSGYNQVITKNEIKNFKTDGGSSANFYLDDLQVWDYKLFADKARQVIEKEINPMREHLISYDIEINKLREKLNNDSVSVRNDLTSLIDKILLDQLKKYDDEPLPMQVFSLKIADLEYRSAALEHQDNKDSTNILLLLEQANRESKSLTKLDSVAGKLMASDIDKKAEDYANFIANTYSNTVVLKSYIKALKEYAERERRKVDQKLAERQLALQWIVIGQDSIPLFQGAKRSRFKPLLIAADQFTTGLAFRDSLNADAYFYSITPSRVPDIKANFPVDKTSFRESKLPFLKSLVYSDPAGQIFFVLIYNERAGKDNKYGSTLAKVYRSDGLAWNFNYSLPFIPKEISFKQETGELIIRNDGQQTVVDKNGKVK
jgi:hypothetical protein